ncbi:glycosyltransferase family 35 protein [Phaffia rhodozyma]|uniref:Alpha-1,4 glucan phosphorylase n=1 Tax=Phaffia rhodozyma TaxID=264483 RepID=A0A0F7ST63_PHARH|nr:glycosyltransferase family 35 protein [Phaffia rhodozyma]
MTTGTSELLPPGIPRRTSLVGGTVNTKDIGTPAARPKRNHKRSLTGNYVRPGEKVDASWPLGDEKAWKEALEADGDLSIKGLQKSIVHNLTTGLARQAFNLPGDNVAAYQATALSVRDQLIRQWNETTAYHTRKSPKRIYYLSLEFLMGRSLDNTLLNLKLKPEYTEAVKNLGFSMEDLLSSERDAGLGNGGLGRLAACYVDAMATLNLPGWGYGLRYQYGIFKQLLDENGGQLEAPDPWLNNENPWEIVRLDVTVPVRFYGRAERVGGAKGKGQVIGGQEVLAIAYDTPVPGFNTKNTSNIRFWSAKPISGFDLQSFNAGNYEASVKASQEAESITRVLYPNDNSEAGKELRLKQQYFWTSASLFDILRRFRKLDKPFTELPDYVAIQLNDTHPTLAIPELMRVLIDEEDVEFDQAWAITTKVFAYTNHTVLPEALEKWSVPLMQHLLPRIMQIIFDINFDFLQAVEKLFPGDVARLGRMSLIQEGYPQYVRMANLAVIGSHRVNGVAELHSELVQTQLFPDFVEMFGKDHFTNVTNGVSPRRFIDQSNPDLSQLLTKSLGTEEWKSNMYLLKKLDDFIDDESFRAQWLQVKKKNKQRLAHLIDEELGIKVSTEALFDVQIKRIHEYKRQSMNILGVIHRYLRIKNMSPEERKSVAPHVTIFAGKAAPGYHLAKQIIRLIVVVSKIINNDTDIGDLLKLVFLPDYSVSLAEILCPAADISQQISTAGTEASGTSCMKFAMNGALMLGTVDGANIEIAEEAGEDNVFFFGYLTPEVAERKYQNQYHPVSIEEKSPALAAVFQWIRQAFGDQFNSIIESITVHGDTYLVADDFDSYIAAQKLVDDTFKDQEQWVKRSITTVSRMGKFNSDRFVGCECLGVRRSDLERRAFETQVD